MCVYTGACPGGGAAPQKKIGHRSTFEPISPIFATFLVRNIIFSAIF